MRILGIDPGSVITGYGVVEGVGARVKHVENGVVRPPSGAAYVRRLVYIFERLVELMTQWRPEAVAIEEVFFAKNARSALHLGQARGVALLAAGRAGLPVHEYATRTVKQSIVGVGNATKPQIQFMVTKLLHLPEPPAEDAADALAVALTHAQMIRVKHGSSSC